MNKFVTDLGLQRIMHRVHAGIEQTVVVGQSVASRPDPDVLTQPGSSYLWLSGGHHLDRQEVRELMRYLSHWVNTGRLFDHLD